MKRRPAHDDRGAELVEFALVLPLLLVVMFGIVDFGFLFQRLEVVTNAAREGARLAALPGYADADVTARVDAYLSAAGVPGGATTSVAIERVTVGERSFNVARVTVSATYEYLLIGPIMAIFGGSFSSVPLNAVAVMRVESQGS